MFEGRQQALFLQQFLDDAVPKPKPCAGLGVPSQRGQQRDVAAPTTARPHLPGSVPTLKDDTCIMLRARKNFTGLERQQYDSSPLLVFYM